MVADPEASAAVRTPPPSNWAEWQQIYDAEYHEIGTALFPLRTFAGVGQQLRDGFADPGGAHARMAGRHRRPHRGPRPRRRNDQAAAHPGDRRRRHRAAARPASRRISRGVHGPPIPPAPVIAKLRRDIARATRSWPPRSSCGPSPRTTCSGLPFAWVLRHGIVVNFGAGTVLPGRRLPLPRRRPASPRPRGSPAARSSSADLRDLCGSHGASAHAIRGSPG
ncbi:hypothetical protein ACU686_15595 [Yinghuangia aomiensis]